MEYETLHEIIKRLKEFRYRAEDICTSRDLDLLISEVKCEIYNNTSLRDEYEERVKAFTEYKESKEEKDTYILDTILDFINYFHPVRTKNVNGGYTMDLLCGLCSSYLYYFPILRYVMGEKTLLENKTKDDSDISNIKPYYGIQDFYERNISNFIFSQDSKLSVLEQNTRVLKIGEFIRDNIGEDACINANFNALEYENYCSIDRDFVTKDRFFTLWMTSALLKVLEVLQNVVKKQLHTYLSMEKEVKRIGKLNNIKTPLTDEEIEILRLRKTLEDNRYEKIAKDMAKKFNIMINKNDIKRQAFIIMNKLGVHKIDQAQRIFEETYYTL